MAIINEKQIKIIVEKSVHKAISAEFMKFRAFGVPLVTPREQKDIECLYKKPSRKRVGSFKLEV
ncbi:MAG: hypothetical protein Q7S34_03505 [bacterium]|nr:hypothetical protein [bacterium]